MAYLSIHYNWIKTHCQNKQYANVWQIYEYNVKLFIPAIVNNAALSNALGV